VTLYSVVVYGEDGGSMVLRNVGILPHHYTASNFSLKMEATWSSETLVSYHKSARHHNSEELDFNLHRRENFSPLIVYWRVCVCVCVCFTPVHNSVNCLKPLSNILVIFPVLLPWIVYFHFKFEK
jgi:hypothetical protein